MIPLTRRAALAAALLLLPRAVTAQVADADAAWNQGRYGAAREAYLRALNADPASVRAAYRLGVLAAWDGNLDSALTYLARARAADPNDPDVRVMEAQVLTWAGRYPQALVQWDSLIALHPERIDGPVGKARTLAWDGRSAEADSLFDVVLARDPTNAEALDGKAQLAYWDGRTEEAIAGYERALSYRPDDVAARIGLAQVYRAAGRQLDALAEADSAVALAPGNREAEWTQIDVGRTTLAAVDLSLGWSDDSDDNTMWWQVVAATTPLSNRVRGIRLGGILPGHECAVAVGHSRHRRVWRHVHAGGLAADGGGRRAGTLAGERALAQRAHRPARRHIPHSTVVRRRRELRALPLCGDGVPDRGRPRH